LSFGGYGSWMDVWASFFLFVVDGWMGQTDREGEEREIILELEYLFICFIEIKNSVIVRYYFGGVCVDLIILCLGKSPGGDVNE